MNEMAFTPEEVSAGMAMDLIHYLIGYNQKSNDHFNEIRITSDSYCTIIQWEHKPYSGEWGGSFRFCDEDEEIGTWVTFPDNSTEFVPKDTVADAKDEWYRAHTVSKATSDFYDLLKETET